MNAFKAARNESVRISRYAWCIATFWTALIVALFLLNSWNITKELSELARLEAITSFNKDTVYRRWATMHGGVYVPVSEDTPPNPYLSVPERDIETPSGQKLTLVNPAYMTRQVHDLGKKQYGIEGNLTSLQPLNPMNAPDAWEGKTLKLLEGGEKEVASPEMIQGEPYFRLIRPLITEEGCLKCHAHQGFKAGDIRGGISIAVPMQPYLASAQRRIAWIATGLGILWFIGAVGLWSSVRQIQKRVREREGAEKERNQYIENLQEALSEVRQLSGLLPICSYCKNIRDEKGYWNKLEVYIRKKSNVNFSHGICQECAEMHFPGMMEIRED